jgi:hypothetical protein
MSIDEEIQRDFPALNQNNSELRSPKDFNYNCLAFALGDEQNWWEPPGEFGFYWPPGFPKDLTVPTVIGIINVHGFVVESDLTKQPETDSIAIYAKGPEWTHFAKFTAGRWTSKLGVGRDIYHSSPKVLEGDLYGEVVKILSRQRESLP